MNDAGLLAGQRFELIDGDLIDKMGQKPAHAYVIRIVLAWLARLFDSERLQVQLPIEVNPADRERTLPEPDLAVLAEAKREYQSRYPSGDELLLLIEVSDSTVQHDLTVKRDLYARAGVREYWVIDLTMRQLRVHRNLSGGKYGESKTITEDELVVMECKPAAAVKLSILLPET